MFKSYILDLFKEYQHIFENIDHKNVFVVVINAITIAQYI